MENKFVSIGFRNIVNRDRVTAVLVSDNAAAKRTLAEAKDTDCLLDATAGRRVKCLLITDCKQVIACGLAAETILMRLNLDDSNEEDNK